jgi:hypothetical protein
MQPARPISKNALRAMVAIVLALVLVAIYANVQKLRRNRIEKATFTPAPATMTGETASPPP